MPFPEIDRTVSQTSTGTTARIVGVNVREWTVYADTPAGSTATFILQTARDENSTTPAIPFGTSQNLGASSGVCLQFTGPAVIFARVTDSSAAHVVNFRFVGN